MAFFDLSLAIVQLGYRASFDASRWPERFPAGPDTGPVLAFYLFDIVNGLVDQPP